MSESISATIKNSGLTLDSVFVEVQHSEGLNLPKANHIRFFHTAMRGNRLSTDNLQVFLRRNLARYVFSRAQLENYRINDDLDSAVSEAMREWTSRISDTHYCLGSVMGPHPFPTIVRDFQAVISKEIKEQMLVKEGRLPDAVIACVGGGSNAIGSFYHFIEDESVRLIGCEAAGRGIDTFETAATIATGRVGIFHGMKSYFCQNQDGQIAPVYSISAGLDYPGVGPEHAHLHDIGRAEYVPVTDDEAVNAFEYLAKTEGIIPAIESAHAVAYAMKLAPTMDKDKIIVITISGRGDKDCEIMDIGGREHVDE